MQITLNTMASLIRAKIFNEIHKTDVFTELFNAYNRYVEDETSGADYIFDINKQDDIICCVKGGMTAKDIAKVVESEFHYYLFGYDRKTPKPLAFTEVEGIIRNNLDEVLQAVITYPFVEEYRKIYTRYVTNYILGE